MYIIFYSYDTTNIKCFCNQIIHKYFYFKFRNISIFNFSILVKNVNERSHCRILVPLTKFKRFLIRQASQSHSSAFIALRFIKLWNETQTIRIWIWKQSENRQKFPSTIGRFRRNRLRWRDRLLSRRSLSVYGGHFLMFPNIFEAVVVACRVFKFLWDLSRFLRHRFHG